MSAPPVSRAAIVRGAREVLAETDSIDLELLRHEQLRLLVGTVSLALRSVLDAEPEPDRLNQLLQAIRTEGGEWTTKRVLRTFHRVGETPRGAECRAMLRQLHAEGVLTMCETAGRRCYVLARGGESA